MIDNLEIIKPLLNFTDDSKFYFLQIIQRRKENPTIRANNRVIKNYFFNNLEYLEGKYDEIKGLCEFFNARAMLRLNRRSYEVITYETLIKLAEGMRQKNFKHTRKQYTRACGKCHAEPKGKKTWIVDVDEHMDQDKYDELCEAINVCQPEDVQEKIVAKIPSLNGFHLISRPFNLEQFKDKFPWFGDIDVHGDNPCNLYLK